MVNIGKKDPIKTIKYAEWSHNQNRNIANGIQAIGGIGLRISNIYLIIHNFLNLHKKTANDIHTNEDKINQINILLMLKMISRKISLLILT